MDALRQKLTSATLVETLVALSLVSLTVGLGMLIFGQVAAPRSSISLFLLAQQKSGEWLETRLLDRAPGTTRYREVPPLEMEAHSRMQSPELKEVRVTVSDAEGRVIYTRKRLIYAPHTEQN